MQRLYSLLFSLLLFLSFFAREATAQTCGGQSGAGIIGGVSSTRSGKICANADLASGPGAQLKLEAREAVPGETVYFEINWGDGSAVERVNPAATATPGEWIGLSAAHYFPATGAGVLCEYRPQVRLFVNNTLCNPNFGAPPSFTRWNVEGQNTGQLILQETVTNVNEYLVCAGVETTVVFQDRSIMNCVPNQFLNNPHDARRYRKFVYGSNNTINPATGVKIAGTVRTYPFDGPVISSPGTGANSRTPPPPPTTDGITIPADAQVGQIFEITMQYWNDCNPYPTELPVTQTARIRVVAQPAAPPVSNNIVCSGATLPPFTTTVAPPNTFVINWYQDNAGVPGAAITNSLGNQSKTLRTSDYRPGVGINNTTPGVYKVWVSYTMTSNLADPKSCESPRVPITLTIVEDLALPDPPTGGTSTCDGGDLTFTMTAPPGSTTNGGPVSYEWSLPANVTAVGTPGTAGTFHFAIGGNFTTAARTIRVRKRYDNNPNCPSPWRDILVTIYGPTQGGTVAGGGTFCENADPGNLTLSGENGAILRWEVSIDGAAFTPTALTATNIVAPGVQPKGTYIYRAVVKNGTCAQALSSTATITVVPGATAGLDQALCSSLTSNALNGNDPSPSTGVWTVTAQPASSNVTFVSGPTVRNTKITVDKTGIYTLRWTIGGTCYDEVNVDFGIDPGPQSAGTDTPVCGTSYVLQGSTPTSGVGTWTLVSTTPAAGTVSFSDTHNPNATVTLTGAPVYGVYRFRWSVASGTCTVQQANVSITFNRVPTATVMADFNSCISNRTAPAAINITGNVVGAAGQQGRWEIISGNGKFGSASAAGLPSTPKTGTVAETYTPTSDDYDAGFVTLKLVAIGVAPCTNVSSTTLRITFDKVPGNINAGPDQLLLCTGSTTLAALAPTNGGIGHWSTPTPGVTFTNNADRNTTVSNLPVATTTLTWTVTSALGLCTGNSATVQLKRNPLPTANDLLSLEVCENPIGSQSASNVVLNVNDNNVTGSAANTTVEWFTDAVPAGPIVPSSTPQAMTTASPASREFFTRVTNSLTGCTNTARVLYTITSLPAATPFAYNVCEDFPVGSNKVDNIDLTASGFLTGVAGTTTNRAITWYTDAAATASPIPTPAAFDITGSQIIYARVRNTLSGCENVAAVNLNIKSRPLDQALLGKSSVCVNALELYQVSAVTNATYQWTIPASFDTFLGGTTGDFLALLSFPAVATGDIGLTISVNGCAGNPITKHVEVSPTPAPFAINLPTGTVCENEIGVPFSVTPNNYPSSNYNWEIDPIGGALVSTGQTTGSVLLNFLTSNVTIKVTESNASNCAGPPQQTVVIIKPRPTLGDFTAEICSEDETGITLASTATSSVPAVQYNIISAAVDPGLIPKSGPTTGTVLADGILHDAFENPTGGSLRVRYTVEPISADGCPGPSKVIIVTVKPEPLLDITPGAPVCSSTALGRVLAVVGGSVPADRFIIDSIVPDFGLTAVAGNPTTGTFDKNILLDDKWRNQTGGPLQVTYNIRPYNTISQCVGTPALPMTFVIYPEPVVDVATKIICSGDPVNLSPTSTNLPASAFSWTVKSMSPGVNGAVAGLGANINDIITYTGSGTGTVVYTVKGTGPSTLQSCEGPGQDITITVNPAPAVTNIAQTLCSDTPGGNSVVKDLASLESTITSAGGVTITWYSDASLNTQITGGAINAYSIATNTPVYAKVDNGTCFNVATVTYIINPLPQVLATVSQFNGYNVSCNGSTDGEIISTANSGTAPYLYSINGGTSYFAVGNFNSLAPATGLRITVKDDKGCVVTSAPIDILEPPILTISGTPANAKCKGGNDGSIQVIAGGGIIGTYSYSLNGDPYQVSPNFTNLSAGTYSITVKDANSCTKSTTATVGEPPLLTGTVSGLTHVTCNGLSTGSFTVTAGGGTGPYQYQLNSNPFQSSGAFAALPAGTYTVTIKDANNCTIPVNVVITEPAVLTLNLATKTDVDCHGNSTGSLRVAAFGGTAPYQYTMDGGTPQAGGTFGARPAGSYFMEVTDARSCTANVTVVINEPPVLTGSITAQTDVLCFGTSTGSVTVNGGGGSGSFMYKLGTGVYQSSGTFPGLAAGSYVVTVRDQSLCTVPVPVIITEPTVLGGGVTNKSEVSCNGGSNGTVLVEGTGGKAPYQYELDGGGAFVSLGSFTGLPAGSHTVLVRDANLCTFPVPFTITEPTVLTAQIDNKHNVKCKGDATGDVTVKADLNAGTAPYEYSINGSNFNTTGFFDNLTVGSYTVTVRDAKGCQVLVPVVITEPDLLTVTVFLQKNVDCKGNSTGEVTLEGHGGTIPYEFADASNAYNVGSVPSQYKFTALAAGAHTFTIRDGQGCITPIVVNITEPDLLTLINKSQTDVLCHGQNSGNVTVEAGGGAGSYEYSKNNVNFSPLNVFGGLTAGAYTITVRDANGCKTQLPVTITEPDALAVTSSLETKKVSCYLGSDGELTVTATGGNTSQPYTFLLLQDPTNTSGQITGVFTALRASTYTVRITDANNCSLVTLPIVVTQYPQLKVTAAITSNFNGYPISCENATDGVIKAASTGGTASGLTYTISPDPNNVISNTTGEFTNLGADLYTISVTDDNGCPAISLPVVINPPFPMTAGFVGYDQSVCIGATPGVIKNISPAYGGTGDYHYQWQSSTDNTLFIDIPGETNKDYQPLSSLADGTYYYKRVVILISGGCGALESNVVSLKINPLPEVQISTDHSPVCEGEMLIVTLDFTTGLAPFRFDYTKTDVNGTTTINNSIGAAQTQIPVLNFSESATFTITRVKDFNGCVSTVPRSLPVVVKKINSNFTIVGPSAQCNNKAYTFQWTVDPDVEYRWEFADGRPPRVIPANSRPLGLDTVMHFFAALPPTNASTFVPVTLSAESVGALGPHCGPKQITQTVELFPSIYIDVPSVGSPICSGTLVNFQNLTQGATVHSWIYRTKSSTGVLGADNGMGNNLLATQTFVNNTGDPNKLTYEIVYTGKNNRGCTGSKSMEIVVYKSSIAQLTHTPVPPTYNAGEAIVTFENTSSPIDGVNFTYAWDFGTNATPAINADDPGPHMPVSYAQPGAKRATLTVTNRLFAGCTTTDADVFTIIVPPLYTDFVVKPLFSCSPATIVVENRSVGADTWLWTLMNETGSASTSTLRDPVFVVQEPGIYSLTLESKYSVSNQPGITRTLDNITVYARPQAIFSARPTTFFVPDVPVNLANDSQGANIYEWDFGDGATSTEVEPDHQYELEGTYVIMLRAINDHGFKDIDGDGQGDVNIVCADTVTAVVTGREGGATKIPNAFTPNSGGPTGGVDNGAGMNDVFLPITSGVQEFQMDIFDRWGNLIFQSKDKNIGWDGYDKDGRLMPAGVYVYKLTLRLADDQRETRIGDITLIR
jgi:gliding motility-associated-like protein